MDNHKWEHIWVALTNPDSEDFSAINGYLKLSANIYGADDEPTELKEDENENDGECQMPASVKPKFMEINLHILRGEHLPRQDVAMLYGKGKIDAFVQLTMNGKTIKTKAFTTNQGVSKISLIGLMLIVINFIEWSRG